MFFVLQNGCVAQLARATPQSCGGGRGRLSYIGRLDCMIASMGV